MTDPQQPTVVLVHGAFADASGFAGIFRELVTSGYDVVAPPNPLRSLSSDAAALSAVVSAIDGPVVLVGHSYGGAVITQASAGLDNVTKLVYLAAFGLDEGESAASSQEPFPPSLLGVNNYPTSYDAPGAPQGPDLYIKTGTVPRDVLRRPPRRRGRVHGRVSAPAVGGRVHREVHRGGLADPPVLVPGLRARQRHPAGRRAVLRRADEGDDRGDQRVPLRLHRPAGGRGQLH